MEANSKRCSLKTPFGGLILQANSTGLSNISFLSSDSGVFPKSDHHILNEACKQLTEYFAGQRKAFTIPLTPHGTLFQKQVWKQLCTVPYGQTVSYRDIAVSLGNPSSCRAIGFATGKNPLPVIIPCHRVIGKDGRLTGYRGGLFVKEWLLNLEAQK